MNSNTIASEYVVYSVEYFVGMGVVDKPAYYIIGIYDTEEEAIDRKNREEENALNLGFKNLKFHVEEIKVFDSRMKKKKTKRAAYEVQESRRRWSL